MSQSWPRSLHFSSFLQTDNSKCLKVKKIAIDCMRTQVLWYRKRPLCQLCHQQFPKIVSCFVIQMMRKQAASGMTTELTTAPNLQSPAQTRLEKWLKELDERQRQNPGGRSSNSDLLVNPSSDQQLMARRRGSHSPRIQRANSSQDQGIKSL